MEKIYFYRVEAKVIKDHEEFTINEDFKGPKIDQLRSDAFDFFDDIADEYFEQFLEGYSLLEIFLKVSSVTRSKIYDYDGPFLVDGYEDLTFTEFTLMNGILHNNQLESEILSNTSSTNYSYLETYIISELKKKLKNSHMLDMIGENTDNSNRASKYQTIQCDRCSKNMEVEKTIADLYLTKKSKPNKKVKMSCKSCIDVYFSALTGYREIQCVYDKNGKSAIKGKKDLQDEY